MMDKLKKMVDINKFSFAQMTSNTTGKTSASGTMGVFTISIGLITFVMGSVDYFIDANNDIMVQSIILIGIGAGLLGYRKSKDGKEKISEEEATEEQLNS